MKALLLGSGELGKEVAIELERMGVQVVAVDRYQNAPAMHVTPRSRVVDMTDAQALRSLIDDEFPDLIIPEIEAIATSVLADVEREGTARVVPTALATGLTMNREGIRRLAAEELGLPTSPYRFVGSADEMRDAVVQIGFPCVVKPVMSSSGKGQSVVRNFEEVTAAWDYAITGSRGASAQCIVEGFVDFDEEITLLTVRHSGGVTFFDPIHHRQVDGDFVESWQNPQGHVSQRDEAAQSVARRVVEALGGYGVFGVELFLQGDQVIFSEVSPRPHDTGLVTMVSGDISEFAAHARAIIGIDVAAPTRHPGAAACVPVSASGRGVPSIDGLAEAHSVDPSVQVRVFGKPWVDGRRRVAVVGARGETAAQARGLAHKAAAALRVSVE